MFQNSAESNNQPAKPKEVNMFGHIPGRDFAKARMAKFQKEARERRLRTVCSDSITQRINWKLSAIWKFILSFRKSQWKIDDYPLRYCFQDNQEIDIPSYYVEVIGWKEMIGFGDSREQAYQYLSRKLEQRSLSFGFLPRPGTTVPVESKERDEQLRRLIQGAFTANLSDSEITSMAEFLKQLEETG
jgi:hypothetical protein